ncbi:MAG: cytosine deaminase [Spirulina sp. SIO3F2]|nr:cytosine deaminase [Spirulina sp. SIO3F2]
MTQFDLIIRQAYLGEHPQYAHQAVDLGITNGKFSAIAPCLTADAQAELNATDCFISPPFVESHIHLDSALTIGQPRWNESGTLFEGIEIWRDRKQNLSFEDVQARAIATLKCQAEQGVLFVRTHADVSEASLIALKALLAVREQVKDWLTLQVVAFPQDGLWRRLENLDLMQEAIQLGADAIGGIPHYELTREDGVASVEKIFELAQKHERLIDIHCDEIDDEQSRFLEVMAAQTIRTGLGSRVTASHTTAFGSYNNAYAQKLLGFLQNAQLNIIANPLINITLQGRGDSYPKRRGLTRVKELWQHGINVSFGHDCIQDPWYSLGTGNMLDVAMMAIHACQMTGRSEMTACYEMITTQGAQTLHVCDRYGLEIDKPASFLLFAVPNAYEVLRQRLLPQWVYHNGQCLVETPPTLSHWHYSPSP